MVSADETGVIQSVRPTVTRVGQRSHPVGIGDGVLHGDEPAVGTAGHDDLLYLQPLPQRVHVGGPLGVRERRLAFAAAAAAGIEDHDAHLIGERAERGSRLLQ
jgi:hypothetical protein